MRNKSAALFLLCAAAFAQPATLDPRSTMHITFPEDSPVTVVSADWGESSASPRGGALLLDLHTSLSLRNSGARRIRGITLLVTAQEVTPGGKASVSVPSLNVAAGENFPIRIDLRLLRPLQPGSGPLVEVMLDGVLFDDLSFYGPNRLNSRRSMTVWELEARRDRRHFRSILESRGPDALQGELAASMQRQAKRAAMDARVSALPPTNIGGPQRRVQFAFLDMADSPLDARSGSAIVARDALRSPRVNITNVSGRPVRGIEIGWIVKDARGKEYVGGAVPMDLALKPGQSTVLVQDAALKFAHPGGQPLEIEEVTAFLSSVEFGDGNMWVPSRNVRVPTPSPEEQRLVELYRKRGLSALVDELRKF